MLHVLIFGGTGEARALAGRLVPMADIEVVVSLAGRTDDPIDYPCQTISGGFGGAEGLAAFLTEHHVDLAIDATHPFATQMQDNVDAACRLAKIPAFRLARSPWVPVAGDRWIIVDSFEAAIDAAGGQPRRIFLSIGRQQAALWARAPQHHYLIRSVEPVTGLENLPDAAFILDRGPFDIANEIHLLETHRIDLVVTKQSGGEATKAKLDAARQLGLPVIMIRQKTAGTLPIVRTIDEAVQAIETIRTSAAY